MRITPQLEKPDKAGQSRITFILTFSGQRYYLPTREKIDSDNWDEGKRVIKQKQPGYTSIRQRLNELENRILEIVEDAKKIGAELTKDLIWQKLGRLDKKKEAPTIIEVIRDWQEKNKFKRKPSYIRKGDSLATHLSNFKPDATLKDITPAFVSAFTDYLILNGGRKKKDGTMPGATNNTIGWQINGLRNALRHGGMPFEWLKDDFSSPTERMYLTAQEVAMLENWKAPESSKVLEDVRDSFLFGCYTGLRDSDLRKLSPEHIKEEKGRTVFRIVQTKTSKPVKGALNSKALAIIQRQKGKHTGALYMPSNQKLNASLKTIGKSAGLTAQIKRTRFKGSTEVVETFEKWQLLSMHIARHTYATQSLERGMNPADIAASMGITLDTVSVYMKVVEDSLFDRQLKAWE